MGKIEVEGQLLNTNTIDNFKTIDKNGLLKQTGAKVLGFGMYLRQTSHFDMHYQSFFSDLGGYNEW